MSDATSPSSDNPPGSVPEHFPPPHGTDPATGPVTEDQPPAGFWVRLGAFIVDGFLYLLLFSFLGLIFQPMIVQTVLNTPGTVGTSVASVEAYLTYLYSIVLAWILVCLLLIWLYHAVLESSRWQATAGKQVFGLLVTDREGQRLSFLRACARWLAKWISLIPFGIGFLMVGFTDGKRGLHDMLAGTRVFFRSAAHRDSKTNRYLLWGIILLALVLLLTPILLASVIAASVFQASPPVQREPVIAALATQDDGMVIVTWFGGMDNDLVTGYTVTLGDPPKTYPGGGELYPPEIGNMTQFGLGASGSRLVIEAILKDGRQVTVADQQLTTPSSSTPLQTTVAMGSPTPVPEPVPDPSVILPLGSPYRMDDNAGKQIISLTVESTKQTQALYYSSGFQGTELSHRNPAPGNKFVLVSLEILLVGLHGEGMRTNFMTPLPSSFTLWDGTVPINVTDPEEFDSVPAYYLRNEGSLYHPRLITKETPGDSLLVFEVPATMDARKAMVRFCPVNDPDWESSAYPRLDDRWDCETGTIAWRLA